MGNREIIIGIKLREISSEVKRMKLIERTNYLNKLISVMGTPDIKVITGVRRSGKSKLLEAFKEYIQNENSNANLIHINFNLLECRKRRKLYRGS